MSINKRKHLPDLMELREVTLPSRSRHLVSPVDIIGRDAPREFQCSSIQELKRIFNNNDEVWSMNYGFAYPIHYAVHNEDPHVLSWVLEKMLSKKINPNLRLTGTKFDAGWDFALGDTPVNLALRMDMPEKLEILLRAGCNKFNPLLINKQSLLLGAKKYFVKPVGKAKKKKNDISLQREWAEQEIRKCPRYNEENMGFQVSPLFWIMGVNAHKCLKEFWGNQSVELKTKWVVDFVSDVEALEPWWFNRCHAGSVVPLYSCVFERQPLHEPEVFASLIKAIPLQMNLNNSYQALAHATVRIEKWLQSMRNDAALLETQTSEGTLRYLISTHVLHNSALKESLKMVSNVDWQSAWFRLERIDQEWVLRAQASVAKHGLSLGKL